MPIDAKISYTRELERSLADVLTASDLAKVLGIAGNLLDGYEMYAIERTDGHDDLLESFVASMHVQGRSEKTIARYVSIIKKMMVYVNTQTRNITVHHIRRWLASEKERGVQESTLEGLRQIMSAYFGWLYREGLIEKNPVGNLGTIKVPKKQRDAYSEIDLEKLNRSCRKLRDRAILNFLISTGCRVSEMTELNRDMVNLTTMECTVHGKGDKWRTVYMSSVACMLLQEYLRSRKDDNEALFLGKRGRLHPDGVRTMLKKLADRAGVEKVHPHRFRRTLATELTRHGMPIQEVAAILGHEKLDTTMRYVALCKDDVKASYRKYA